MNRMNIDQVINVLQDYGYSVAKSDDTRYLARCKDSAPLILFTNQYGVDVVAMINVTHILQSNPLSIHTYTAHFCASASATKAYAIENALRFEATIPWHISPEGAHHILTQYFNEANFIKSGKFDEYLDKILDAELSAQKQEGEVEDQPNVPNEHCTCDWCNSSIKYGNALFHIDRLIGQIDWNAEEGSAIETVIDTESLLTLCGECGNKFKLDVLREKLNSTAQE